MSTDHEGAWRQRVLDAHDRLEIPGFQSDRPIVARLVDMYVQRSFLSRGGASLGQDHLHAASSLAVRGGAGTGKTTLLAFLAVKTAQAPNGRPVPFLLQGDRLPAEPLSADVIARALGLEPSFVHRSLQSGLAVVLVDDAETVHGLDTFARLCADTGSKMVVASRTVVSAQGLGPAWDLQPLSDADLDAYAEKWSIATEVGLHASTMAVRAMRLAQLETERLRRTFSGNSALRDLARTPLYALWSCTLHRYLGRRLPERAPALHEAYANLLLGEAHVTCLTKFGVDELRDKFGSLALAMARAGTTRAMRQDVVDALGCEAGHMGPLHLEADGTWAFAHRSLRDFMVARSLVAARDWTTLASFAEDTGTDMAFTLAGGIPGVDLPALIDAAEAACVAKAKIAACLGMAARPPKDLTARATEA